MANGWNSGSDREAMLRRVAIVLSSLPAPVAARMLGGIDADSTQAIRRTMTSLSDVDPLERKRAFQAFKVSVELPSHSPPASSPTARVVSDVPVQDAPQQVESTSVRSPLAFLAQVDDQALVRLLTREHPQTVALVLASMVPDQAARVLSRLDPRLQTEALGRIGRLGEIPDDAVAEVAAHFQDSLSQQSSSPRTENGSRALDAILAAMPVSQNGQDASGTTPSPTASKSSESRPATAAPSTQYQSASSSFPTADVAILDLTEKLRVAQETIPTGKTISREKVASPSSVTPRRRDTSIADTQNADTQNTDTQNANVQGNSPRGERLARPVRVAENRRSAQKNPVLGSTDSIHQHLLKLPTEELCQTLGKVDTRVAMLALCGLPNQVTESVLTVLPRSQAKQVRNKMNSLGSLNLREIDQAKETVARASLEHEFSAQASGAVSSKIADRTPIAA